MTATLNAVPQVPAFPAAISDEQRRFLAEEQFLLMGRILSDRELVDLRFGYERIWESRPLTDDEKIWKVPGTRACSMEAFLEEPMIMSLIGNPYVLRMAEAALGTTDIEYAGGYLHKHRLNRPWTWAELGWPGWHQDGKSSLDPLNHINVWIYLDDLTKYDGVTQVLLGSTPLQRENLRAGRDPNTGYDALKAAQDTYETGVYTPGPAGGGFAWSGSLVHRITPNQTGVGRRLVTYEFRTRQHGPTAKSLYRDKTTPEQRKKLAAILPADKRFLVDL